MVNSNTWNQIEGANVCKQNYLGLIAILEIILQSVRKWILGHLEI